FHSKRLWAERFRSYFIQIGSEIRRPHLPATAEPGTILLRQSRAMLSTRTSWPARHDQVRDLDLHSVPVLVKRGRAHLDQPLFGPRLRWAHLEDLALEAQLVAGTHRAWPVELGGERDGPILVDAQPP